MALPTECSIHGLCGINELCIYSPEATCTCILGFHMKDPVDRFKGCDPDTKLLDPGSTRATQLIYLIYTDFYNNDLRGYSPGLSLKQ
ncbi:hypothetical protein KI387_022163, partial [Taxus chinensis]